MNWLGLTPGLLASGVSMERSERGFSLIELLIAIAIIGILAAVAVPSYQKYARKAYYTEVVQAAVPIKLLIEECYQAGESLADCQPGKAGIPSRVEANHPSSLVDHVVVSDKAVITVTPRNLHGIQAADDYILTPQEGVNHQLVWLKSGGGLKLGYVN